MDVSGVPPAATPVVFVLTARVALPSAEEAVTVWVNLPRASTLPVRSNTPGVFPGEEAGVMAATLMVGIGTMEATTIVGVGEVRFTVCVKVPHCW